MDFTLNISPAVDTYSQYQLKEVLKFDHEDITITGVEYKDGQMFIRTTYTGDLEGKCLKLMIKDDAQFNPSDPDTDVYSTDKVTFRLSSTCIDIHPINNLGAYYYDQAAYA